ncbi:hypothetical protein SSIM_13660 [Staphylococcus simulans UMC-CNS-990]|uniref:Uncharacterized protein n=1 Tax=Staphylococcus simulans UMC-CNS-990 TaxID=1405498 RepID=A0ABP2YPT8_STASI|nr:hypothetical protein SSIM_13660 [Staphylococcus simulans UMC-CNS-990]
MLESVAISWNSNQQKKGILNYIKRGFVNQNFVLFVIGGEL